MKTQAHEQRKRWFKNKRKCLQEPSSGFQVCWCCFCSSDVFVFWCFGVLLASWVLWCPLCSVVLSLFSVSFLFNKVSLFESVVLGPIPHQTWRVQSLPLLLWTPVLPQMSGAAGRDFDLTASVVCVCFSCDWMAHIHPGCWQSRAWAVLLGRLASLLTGPPLLSGHSFSCFKLVACLKVLESPLHRPQPL